ncbi:ATP:corrinoid adenosyltransferase BtuR/CobO/CobP [uncultured archaeon]|nr:ATP:corrinoid adenosyltransferase BtuR/CobO/CobP [uncultured archaeon]
MAKLSKGLIEVFHGDGRGKTSAAVGTAARAAGHGLKVALVQFLKGGEFTGEVTALKKLGVEVHQLGPNGPSRSFDRQVREGIRRVISKYFRYHESDIERSAEGLKLAARMLSSGEYDLVILDEVDTALKFKHFRTDDLANALKRKHERTEVILTGFKPPQKILRMADLITDMKKVRHPYDKGILARWGIDY